MLVPIGLLGVLGAVVGGYIMAHGNLSVLFQPAEFVIIFGAALGALVISAPKHVLIGVIKGAIKTITGGGGYSKKDYLEVLLLLTEIFTKIRKEGLISIEQDVEEPQNSPIFSKYPKFMKNHHALGLLTDTLRTVMTTTVSPYELESILDSELETLHETESAPAKNLNHIAESLPGLGIVAAVLGVVITMGKIKEPPDVLGHSIGAALVGTFLGVLMCYGFVGPLARRLEASVNEEKEYLQVIKSALVSFVGGAAPQIAVEFARRGIPPHLRPSFYELEEEIRALKSGR
ncbi:MAG: flagellar motor stator protein MotA [Thermodesulfovibrio sp.]|uniref:flagellar motor stator protein MotA n=1 Tax=unclassified Thermodesulfovibrio TaxID=2645936 RepID=UPI00083A34FC|nr:MULTISPECIES: flagellar motor stator protein MotA [unclassified Thermodesulfovibrio]MDI1472874.1 flagellar motor stator protein MotA [Thermodesulfovibrio sp. 1176]MDI6714885.1 flagellar motor stator protein MotA [Thermodesulfovibrio sp.]ODA44531.1 Flagellar motor rotation protein MotA [Thermodesulfovibrio sp. N1]